MLILGFKGLNEIYSDYYEKRTRITCPRIRLFHVIDLPNKTEKLFICRNAN